MNGLNGILQSAKVNPESNQAIEVELSKHRSLDNFVRTMKTERAFSIDMSRSQFSSPVIACYGGDYLAGFDSWIANGLRSHEPIGSLDSLLAYSQCDSFGSGWSSVRPVPLLVNIT